MTYGMTFTGERTDYDRVLNAGEFEIYVDTVAYHYLRGVEIDFVERGPGSASFVFNNVFQSVGGTGACSACGAAG
ncbi:MAG: iron-sulfur cluster assembly accessory protein, partial [Gammaproteobacteria bacterium]|nr:iron-sulfur cluster assembly accessory protein [Gammaproteobacteria bacterium]NIR85087.1 iron-sulfur cluster assembly accessory protein [Gammaproteobacteria bacterium]NIU03691.1 iron-sulfur cluster assembly accessory protein [Gammaproteobacteria bacterium]NIV51026.1 iron-sulfur cluster assembly accessory protein [Gammaproteobacteria bacterium]NIX84965.1 iron-sulfur cluster assembly accessory protein [Gammaproteobacteria bacterium]